MIQKKNTNRGQGSAPPTGGKIDSAAGEFDRVDREAVSGENKKSNARWLSNYITGVGFVVEAARI